MQLDVEFPILHGKVGNWPGDINPQCAEVIYKTALSFEGKPNSVFVDMGAGTGRSTIFLAAAAQQIGAKVYAIDNWQEPSMALWFDRAMRLFRMSAIVTPVRDQSQMAPAEFVVLHSSDDAAIDEIWEHGVCPGGALMVVGNVKPDAIKQAGEHGMGFHMWRKKVVVEVPTAPITTVLTSAGMEYAAMAVSPTFNMANGNGDNHGPVDAEIVETKDADESISE